MKIWSYTVVCNTAIASTVCILLGTRMCQCIYVCTVCIGNLNCRVLSPEAIYLHAVNMSIVLLISSVAGEFACLSIVYIVEHSFTSTIYSGSHCTKVGRNFMKYSPC